MKIELRSWRRHYQEGYDVLDVSRSSRGRRIGMVMPIWGRRQYKPEWDACDSKGRPVGNPKSKMSALFPVGTQINDRESNWKGGGLWPSRKAAVEAITTKEAS